MALTKIDYGSTKKEYKVDIDRYVSLSTTLYGSKQENINSLSIRKGVGTQTVNGQFVVSGSIIVVDPKNYHRVLLGRLGE